MGAPTAYVIDSLRSLVTEGWDWDRLGCCAPVIGGLMALLATLSPRAIDNCDDR
jgi:hypothetical protein